jgi:alpha-D-xyloside xylohydrolase
MRERPNGCAGAPASSAGATRPCRYRAGRTSLPVIALFVLLLTFLIGGDRAGPRIALAGEPADAPRPLAPRWVFEPWVWEDNVNTQQATLQLVLGYRQRAIPVGAVIVDSPWQTYYNSFEFCIGTGAGMYEDPQALIDSCHAMDVRVILWSTGMVNAPGTDKDGCNDDPRPNFCNPQTSQYFVDPDCSVRIHWWKNPSGVDGGKLVDFRDPDATSWWIDHHVSTVLQMGIDGFKVDETDKFADRVIASNPDRRAYADAYYTAMYEAVLDQHGEQAMISARPYDQSNLGVWGGYYAGISAPVAANPAGWVGDQTKSWDSDGFLEALDNMCTSGELGYVAFGSDIGGFLGDGSIPHNLFRRWAQFGALSPIMNNGGNGEHRPWMYPTDILDTYRRFAKLHHFLVPYLYSGAIDFLQTGVSLMRPMSGWDAADNTAGTRYTYMLGDEIFVAVIYEDDDSRRIAFPPGTWVYLFDDDQEYEGTHDGMTFAGEDYPVYVRKGAFVPLAVDQDDDEPGYELEVGSALSADFLTLLYYPLETSSYVLRTHRDTSITINGTASADSLAIDVGPSERAFIIRAKWVPPCLAAPVVLQDGIAMDQLQSFEEFEAAASGWFADVTRGWLWLKFVTTGEICELRVCPTPTPVELTMAELAAGEGGVIITWRTGSEYDHLGFHVARALSGDGRYERLTEQLVRESHTAGTYRYVDRTVELGVTHAYRLEAVDVFGGLQVFDLGSIAVGEVAPNRLVLHQNHPNPFNPSTRISFDLPHTGQVTLHIYNVAGSLVRTLVDGTRTAGVHSTMWDGRDDRGRSLAAGVYWYRLEAGDATSTKQLIMLR